MSERRTLYKDIWLAISAFIKLNRAYTCVNRNPQAELVICFINQIIKDVAREAQYLPLPFIYYLIAKCVMLYKS